MKEPGLTPALCHPDRTTLFPAEKMPERKKPPESLWAALRGQVLCTGILHQYITVIQFRSGSGSQAELLLLRCGQRDVQDAILELCVDVLLLHGVAT